MNEHEKESARKKRKGEICKASLMTQQYILPKPPSAIRGKFYGFNILNVGGTRQRSLLLIIQWNDIR